jgi:hypothetical protein
VPTPFQDVPSPFQDMPQDPETVAAVRRLCDERGYPAACDQASCRRLGRCGGRWRINPDDVRMVLPPCLSAGIDALCWAVVDAEERFENLKLALAIIRKLPDPEAAAERNRCEPVSAHRAR